MMSERNQIKTNRTSLGKGKQSSKLSEPARTAKSYTELAAEQVEKRSENPDPREDCCGVSMMGK